MTVSTPPLGRRERNKQQKLERILSAASDLFARYGVDEVTTQQVADAADIGTGTLFLYAKTKGELLLMVQNAHYERALHDGRAAAAGIRDPLAAIMAVIEPIVACNRTQIDNGRTYLREMVFGDPSTPHHAHAIRIVADTEKLLAELLRDRAARGEEPSVHLARALSAITFLSMASAGSEVAAADILTSIQQQAGAIL